MYNRYLRSDRGIYTRIPQEESTRTASPPRAETPPQSTPSPPPPSAETREDGRHEGFAFLGRLLDRFHLQDIDSADLLLLALLFLLFEENADDELLIALGLLLIL